MVRLAVAAVCLGIVQGAAGQTLMGVEDDLTVYGTNGTTSDPDMQVHGYAIFGTSGSAATVVTQGMGSAFVAGDVEIASNIYVQGEVNVAGTVTCQEVVVTLNGWPDYVFESGYTPMPLLDVEAFVAEHGRLPDMPSAEQVETQGFGMADMQARLLRKIEELTLHLIRLEKENAALRRRLDREQPAEAPPRSSP